jgi:hypothetical protein
VDFGSLNSANLLALAIATSFAAGLNVSATLATIGLLARFDYVDLPPALSMVESPLVIGAALFVFVFEFVLDKIPVVDLVFNAFQTFIRVPAGALLAYGATAQLSPTEQLAASLLGGVVALAAHGGKAALRTGVNMSPEPFTNAAVSIGEDAVAIGLTWFATQYPLLAAAIAVFWIVLVVVFIRWVWRALRALFSSGHPDIGSSGHQIATSTHRDIDSSTRR